MKRLIRISLSLLAIVTLLLVIVSYVAGTQLHSPKRRPLQDYHHSWLNTPEQHGIKVSKGTIRDTPYLVVEPAGSPAKRGTVLRGQLSQVPRFGSIDANLVLLHGRKGRKEDFLPVAERFCAVGFRCILIDLPGHGDSVLEESHFGTTDDEASLTGNIFHALKKENKWPDQPTHLCGMSMGGAFANASLKAHPDLWDRAIIINSFDQLSPVIDRKLKKTGPLKSIIRPLTYQFCAFPVKDCRPAEWVKEVQTPVLVIHGDADDLISHSQGKALYESYPNPDKKFVTVPGGTHTNVLITAFPLYKTMVEWLTQ